MPYSQRGDQNYLKLYNRRKVLGIFRAQGGMSRVELSRQTGLDKKSITNITKELLDKQQIRFERLEKQKAGRPKEILALNGGHARCIGLDFGGSHITGVILDFAGKVLCSDSVEVNLREPLDPDLFFSICSLMIDNLLLRASLTMADISGIGIAIPGHSVNNGQAVLVENIPCLKNVDIRRYFRKKYQKPVLVGDCSQLMALAELHLGAGRSAESFLVFDLGLGIGCGIVINQALYTGIGGKAGEVGHTIVQKDGPPCSCGRRGCIESLASGWALHATASEYVRLHPEDVLAKTAAPGEGVTIKHLVQAAAQGSEYSARLLKNAGEFIGIGISNAISLLNTPLVVLGGRMLMDNPIVLDAISDTIRRVTIDVIYQDTVISVSSIGANASAIGAALQNMDRIYQMEEEDPSHEKHPQRALAL